MAEQKTTSSGKGAATPRTGGPTQADIKRAAMLLEEIASAASLVDRACYFQGDLEDMDPEAVFLHINQLRDAVRRIGWMADDASARIEGDVVRGGVDAWLLPPSFTWSEQSAEA